MYFLEADPKGPLRPVTQAGYFLYIYKNMKKMSFNPELKRVQL